jgi:peptidoglycan/LPS O-acetylase OafA/YrhL
LTAVPPRFPLFDSLRAIAALAVLLFHGAFFTGNFGGDGASRWLTQLNVGVPIFFLVSGFLLYRPFAQARFERKRPPAVVPYAVRRAARIVPAYWIALILIGLWLGIDAIFTPSGVPTYFGFLGVYDEASILGSGGIGHIWTLAVEASFYALLPLWALALRRLPFRDVRGFVATEAAVLGVAFAGAVVWRLLGTEFDSAGNIQLGAALVTLPAYLDHFALGTGLAVASVATGPAARIPGRALAWPLALAVFGVLGLISNVGGLGGEIARHELKGLVALGVLVPAIWVVEGSLAQRVLNWPPLLWVGVVSYGLYLWHPAVLQKMTEAGWDESLGPVLYGIVGLGASLALAAASWYCVERWAIALARRLTRRPVIEPPANLETIAPARTPA